MTESLAMIEEVGVGSRDTGRPILWFTVSGDGWGALQIFDLDEDRALELIGSVREVHELNGRMCVVTKTAEYGGIVRFKKLLPPARTKA